MKARAKELGIQLYKCPNTGEPIIPPGPDDDKVLCRCRKPNPKLVGTPLADIEQRCYGHLRAYLETM